MGTNAPDVDEENIFARPSVGYDDIWAKTLLETTELEVCHLNILKFVLFVVFFFPL